MLSVNKSQMDNICILRVISCIGVLICHLCQRMEVSDIFFQYTQFGQYGIYAFFVISGFLLANSFEKYGKESVVAFIIKRVIRVLALYYAVIIWFFITDTYIFHFSVPDETGWGWKRYFLFLNGFISPGSDQYGYWSNLGASWTIPVFVIAYVSIPIYLGLINKVKEIRKSGGDCPKTKNQILEVETEYHNSNVSKNKVGIGIYLERSQDTKVENDGQSETVFRQPVGGGYLLDPCNSGYYFNHIVL